MGQPHLLTEESTSGDGDLALLIHQSFSLMNFEQPAKLILPVTLRWETSWAHCPLDHFFQLFAHGEFLGEPCSQLKVRGISRLGPEEVTGGNLAAMLHFTQVPAASC